MSLITFIDSSNWYRDDGGGKRHFFLIWTFFKLFVAPWDYDF
jgi:hypothetical protein